MDFYTILKACYREGIAPFALYSQMCDLCKGNLKLHKKTRALYALYSNRDVFKEISLCKEVDFTVGSQLCVCIKRCNKVEQACLTDVARLLHPDWDLPAIAEGSVAAPKIKTPKAEVKKEKGVRVVPKRNAFAPAPAQNIPTPSPQANKTPRQRKAKKISVVKISSLTSDLVVKTSATATDFKVHVLQNGTWTARTKGIGKYTDMAYINLDGVVADEIQCLIPQEKYTALWLDKVQGSLTVEDDKNCFSNVRITLASGKLRCKLYSPSTFLACRVAEVDVQYNAPRNGALEIRNGLGDVNVALQGVGRVDDKLCAIHGKVENRHTPQTSGSSVRLKTTVEYGDIYVR